MSIISPRARFEYNDLPAYQHSHLPLPRYALPRRVHASPPPLSHPYFVFHPVGPTLHSRLPLGLPSESQPPTTERPRSAVHLLPTAASPMPALIDQQEVAYTCCRFLYIMSLSSVDLEILRILLTYQRYMGQEWVCLLHQTWYQNYRTVSFLRRHRIQGHSPIPLA